MALDDLRACCYLLDSSKVTERKKAAEKLSQLLQNEDITAVLNHQSKSPNGNSYNWDRIFQSTTLYLMKESEKLENNERNKENPSLNVRSGWANTKRLAMSLPKLILKKSCIESPLINVKLVEEFVLTILSRRAYLLENYAGDAIQITQKYLLFYHQYYSHITQDKWNDLLRICIWIYDSDIKNVDRVSVLGVIEGIVKNFRESKVSSSALASPSVALRPIANFLSRSIKSAVANKQYGLQGAVLSLLLSVCVQFDSQWRCLLCSIGEETFEDILLLWEDKTTKRQLNLLRYINLQFRLHSSGKGADEQTFNSPNWQRQLKQLYLLIYERVSLIAESCRVTGGGSFQKESLPYEFEILAARLCSQIFEDYEQITSLDITQIGRSESQPSTSTYQPISKKRRVEIGFASILEKLREEGTLDGIIPWYRILYRMLKDYSLFFTSSERAERLLDLLIQILPQCKSRLVIEVILKCLKELVKPSVFSIADPSAESNKRRWTKVAELTIRLIAGKQCSNVGMQLLYSLIMRQLVYPQTSLYKMYLRDVFPLNEDGLKLLQALLLNYPLPKTLKTEDYLYLENEVSDPRMSLLNTLFPLDHELESKNEMRIHFPVNHPAEVSTVIALLNLKNPLKVKVLKMEQPMSCSSVLLKEEGARDQSPENFYFKSSDFSEFILDFSESGLRNTDVNVLDRIMLFIKERIGGVNPEDVRKERAFLTLNIIEMIIYLWPHSRDDKRLIAEVPNLNLVKNYVEKLLLPSSESSSPWNEILEVFSKINDLLLLAKNVCLKNDCHQDLQSLLLAFTSDFQHILAQTVKGREKPNANSSSLNVTCLSRTRINQTIDCDPDFDDDDTQNEASIAVKDVFEDFCDSTSEEETTDSENCRELSRTSLPLKDKAILSLIECLGILYELKLIADPEADDENSPFIACMKTVGELVKSERGRDHIIVLEFANLLFQMHYSEDNIEDGLKMVKQISGRNSKNSKVISSVLKTLKELLVVNGKHLEEEHREEIIHLLKVYSEKFTSGWYGLNVGELIFENVISLVKLDPLRSWSTFTSPENDDRISQIYSLLRSPFYDQRMKVVENIHFLFTKEKGEPLPLLHQKKNFEQLYQIAIESLLIEGKLNAEFVPDEGRGRVRSFLQSLVAVVKSSSALEPQALYAIVSSTKANSIDISAIQCALNSITLPPHISLSVYLESHFDYLISQWMKDRHPLQEFPYQIFELVEYLPFIERYSNQIASSLFMLDDGINEIEKFAPSLQVEVQILLERNFPLIMANLLPFLVASKFNSEVEMKLSKIKISSATLKWKYLESVLGPESLSSHLRNDIGEVVLHLFRLVHDATPWNKDEIVIPPVNNYFDSDVVLLTLNHSHKLFYKDQESLLSLLCDRKTSIQSVLHGLFSDIAKSLAMKSRRLRLTLSPFASFLRLIIPGIGLQLKNMQHFLIRKLVNILANFICEFSSDYHLLAEKCCSLLHDLILACLSDPLSSNILLSTLPLVITRLHSLNAVPAIWNSVYSVLLILFNSDYMPLKEVLASMAPFPIDRDDDKLKNLSRLQRNLKNSYQRNLCLKKIAENFVNISADDVTTYDIENIVQCLMAMQSEICELYESYLPGGLNLAHLLIYHLVAIASDTSDEKKEYLALEGIGKLGPVSLGTSVFVVPQERNRYFQKSEDLGIIADVLMALNRLTFSGTFSLVDACVVALRRILSMKEVYDIVLTELRDENISLDLLPFLPARKPKSGSRQYEDLSLIEFERKINDEYMWIPNDTFDSWLINLTVNLIEAGCGSDFFNHLIPVCKLNVNFCKLLLPYVFLNVLKVESPTRRPGLSKMVSFMLRTVPEKSTSEHCLHQRTPNYSHIAKSCLRTIINVINFIRTKDPKISFFKRKNITSWDRNLWLDVDYVVAAKAAYMCGSLYSAVLFGELACDLIQEDLTTINDNNSKNNNNNDKAKDTYDITIRQLPPLQRITTKSGKSEDISNLLLQASNSLGDSEGVEGCGGLSSVTDGIVQSTLSLHRGLNAQALYISDAIDEDNCLINGLQSVGMYGILNRMTRSSSESNTVALEAKAECAWRLGQWDEMSETKDRGFNQCLLKAFKSLKTRDDVHFQDSRKEFYRHVLSSLKENGFESTSSIYPLLGNLQMFSELSDIFKFLSIKTNEELLNMATSLESFWEEKESFGSVDRTDKERIVSSRITSVRILSSIFPEEKGVFDNILFRLLLKKCDLGTIRDRFRALKEARNIKADLQKSWSLKFEESKLALSLDNKSQAVCSLENILQDIKEREPDRASLKIMYETLVLCGKVLSQSRTRSPKHVIEKYYGKAIALIEDSTGENCCELLEDCYNNVALFGDCLYQEVNNALASDEFQSRKKQIERSQLELAQLDNLISKSDSGSELSLNDETEYKHLWRRKRILERDIIREESEISIQENEAREYLNLSLENYLKVLTCSSKYNLNIYRVIALWLENLTSEQANIMVSRFSSKIKSYKYIPLLYQLVSRLTCSNDPQKQHPYFIKILLSILERVCIEHPHHGLPVVLMLAHSHLDEETNHLKTKGNTSANQHNNVINEEDRVTAAKKLVTQLKKTKLLSHISEMEKVCLAYITLANREDKKTLSKMTPTNSLLMKLQNLEYTAPLTRPIAVNQSTMYDPSLIRGWGPSVELVGGVNHPIKLKIFSSDGTKSNELLKGNDDLRQDAVLEQVFSVVNELLRKDQVASKQNLSVRTYLVCPLSQKTGLIQWCSNTKTYGRCLEQLQQLYYPNDQPMIVCKSRLGKIREIAKLNEEKATRKQKLTKQKSNEQKSEEEQLNNQNLEKFLVQTLEGILSNLHPVFRFFFYDAYPNPEKWFTKRRSYTRSVATSSIAGFILGLGDRHVQNLLLDTSTAEIIHIDLGIAFENGKLLPTPEAVPFRLTQNIIDGFGAMGLEGPLRKNMETTMRVLRESKSVLITIVEVLRHDPLHHWTLSPTQIAKLQKREPEDIFYFEETTGASMAERALLRVQQKLNGLHNGLVVSVPEHVSILIQQATDIKNLASMFCGWQPYL